MVIALGPRPTGRLGDSQLPPPPWTLLSAPGSGRGAWGQGRGGEGAAVAWKWEPECGWLLAASEESRREGVLSGCRCGRSLT